ncbi:BTAD domain-containing putative transcriptional regulator [Nonomuraea muscovyensis]|uniref:Putative ATPase/DNA-binding SARP family transcriptional activator n=1 Tax=Nonomuraea muscovyensis TaxID=1124761 RepID=A0A7X0C9G7_9ACTN|nr:BTAD domain-containing putative transcriptional regulator [Nonomuraea muscovyensis]MBB6351012.1 putative ATPase/DNA-binding SARP family transcriptional activator [Nonomuraea muscovyensis]
MRFGVLGSLAVWTDAGQSVTVPGLKVRALLADLLVNAGQVVSADRLVDDLWRGEPPANPAGALQVRVSQLRRALEDAEPGGKNLVVSRPPGYLLAAAPGALDATAFAELVTRAGTAGGPRERATLLAEALGLWRGPVLADFADEEFARPAITRLEEQRLAALEQHAETRLELGEHGALAAELGDLAARHPLRERLRAAHMLALYRAGRQSEALATYADLRERLADELGLDPGPELAELHRAILVQDPALSSAPPPERPRTNLPAPMSGLIGRDDELAETRALLENARLVTLTGSGGVGKTRLALEIAARAAEAYADGVWLVELAALDRRTAAAAEPGGGPVAEAVLAALDIRESAESRTPAERLAQALRDRRTLLVLDNCEHLVEQVAELVEPLLRAAPGLRVLATSREPLALPGEVLWSVPPLDLPADDGLDAMRRSGAVRLFAARAAASTRGFVLDAGNAEAVARLCRALDGIPLALELAATRVRALGVHGVVARLDDRFRLLGSGPRGVPERQRTLGAVIDWSWDLLGEPERAVLRRLAVHAGGCTLEAAEEVCAAPGADPGLDVLDVLARLVDRSLVDVVETPAGTRYRLLESVAAYCLDRLADAGELDRVRGAHVRHYLALAERAEPALYGRDQAEWLARLDAESANLRAALDTALDTAAGAGAAATAVRLVNALTWYWFLRGRLAEARRSLETALAATAPPDGGPRRREEAPGRARAAAWHAGFVLLLGEDAAWDTATVDDPGERARAELFLAMAVRDVPVAQELLNGALATFREIGDEWGVAAVLSRRGRDHFTQRDLVALERDGEESVRLFGRLGDRWGRLQAMEWLAGLADVRGDTERAVRLFEDGLRMAEELGLWPEAARRTAWLGWMALNSCHYDRAMELCGQAMRLAAGQGYQEGRIMAEMGLALAARRAGLLDLAETHLLHLLDGVPRHPEAEPALHLPTTCIELGFLRELRGDPAAARELHLEALVAAQRIGDPLTVAWAVEGLASASAAAGLHERAARLLGLAAEIRHTGRTPANPSERDEADRVAASARAALGEEAFTAAYERGRTLKPDDAIAE